MNAIRTDVYNDTQGLQALRARAGSDAKGNLHEVAQQFEAIFTQMMLKSMRAASLGDGLLDSQAGDTYLSMFDQQVALDMARSGRGLGIAAMLERQLGGEGSASATQPVGLAAPLPEAAPARTAIAKDAVAFVRSLLPAARAAAEKLGVSVRAVLAQAALETGWGQQVPAAIDGKPSFNLFGIKAGSAWQGPSVSHSTLEFEGGVAVRGQASFRAYASAADSVADYAGLLATHPRYAEASGHGENVAGFAAALQRAGYATDPAYAEKLVAIADGPLLARALQTAESATIGAGGGAAVGVRSAP